MALHSAAKSIETWRRVRGSAVDVVIIEGASHELTMSNGEISPVYETTMIDWDRISGHRSGWRRMPGIMAIA